MTRDDSKKKKFLDNGMSINITEGAWEDLDDLKEPSSDLSNVPVTETGTYQPPVPEFSLDENVLEGVKEPEIEFYGTCSICEIPLTEEYSGLKFCADCADETWQILMSGNKGKGSLPN